ncbi:reverse transcriptase [Lasius niger]|uniref:Reverse transcriptase n=1 Tax=Lasius niger TaxID=67767 RepID=A0A0J7KH51_LASNI|nr:reverse transcriptase [Lasius niger]
MDNIWFTMALEWSCAIGPSPDDPMTAESLRSWITRIITEACDASAPRIVGHKAKSCAYWWSDVIADLRKKSVKARRAWTRSKKRNSPEETEKYRSVYRQAKKTLRKEINKAKISAWCELIRTVDADPWGLPYRIVLKRLRRASPSLTETLDEETLEEVLSLLFPNGTVHDPAAEWIGWN